MGRWLDIARDPCIVQFVEAVREFASLVERVERLPEVYFLQEMDRLLPLLYGLAHSFPDDHLEDLDEDVHLPEGELPKTHSELWQELRESVGRKLGENHRWAHIVFDTMSPNDREVIDADIADMIAEVYLDLVRYLPCSIDKLRWVYARPLGIGGSTWSAIGASTHSLR
jgi:hypothetical protein